MHDAAAPVMSLRGVKLALADPLPALFAMASLMWLDSESDPALDDTYEDIFPTDRHETPLSWPQPPHTNTTCQIMLSCCNNPQPADLPTVHAQIVDA